MVACIIMILDKRREKPLLSFCGGLAAVCVVLGCDYRKVSHTYTNFRYFS